MLCPALIHALWHYSATNSMQLNHLCEDISHLFGEEIPCTVQNLIYCRFKQSSSLAPIQTQTNQIHISETYLISMSVLSSHLSLKIELVSLFQVVYSALNFPKTAFFLK